MMSDAIFKYGVCCPSPDIETKFILRVSPQTHFHCWASQDSGSNSHRPSFFLSFQSFSRHNKPPVV